jgi:diguanylate cyclase (GGDEF)-like protein
MLVNPVPEEPSGPSQRPRRADETPHEGGTGAGDQVDDPVMTEAGGDRHRSFGRRSDKSLFPLSIGSSLVVVVLIPLILAVFLASNAVLHQSSVRRQAVIARQSSLELDSLLQARVDIYAEYIPSAALAAASLYHISEDRIDALLGVNFQANLVTARTAIDRQASFAPKGLLAPLYRSLLAERVKVNAGSVSLTQVQAFFSAMTASIDARWQSVYAQLLRGSASSDSEVTRSRLAALGSSFAAFTSGLGEESLQGGGTLEISLTATATSTQVRSLITSQNQFVLSTSSFPGALGPNGKKAWKALNEADQRTGFSRYVQQGIDVGLSHGTPPYSTNSKQVFAIGTAEVAWSNALNKLVLASSADLRAATSSQAESAARALYLEILLAVLILLAVISGVLLLGRSVRRSLAHLVEASRSVQAGELEVPRLDESGPRELASAAGAFNEMSSTLRAVQAQAIALAVGDLDDPVLQTALPGRTGAALQSALSSLQLSVRNNETKREELSERATRDSLTGLLNRGAAMEALELSLASAGRSEGELELTVLFVDLDELKKINDSLGHDGGDSAIRAVADALRDSTRSSDVVARFGGDEFVVGSLGPRVPRAAVLLADRVGGSLAGLEIEGDDGSVKVGCSVGIAVSELFDTSVETLIERADEALYVAKEQGRGQIRWFGSSYAENPPPATPEELDATAR